MTGCAKTIEEHITVKSDKALEYIKENVFHWYSIKIFTKIFIQITSFAKGSVSMLFIESYLCKANMN